MVMLSAVSVNRMRKSCTRNRFCSIPTSALTLRACEAGFGSVLLDLGPDQLCFVRVAAQGGHCGHDVEDPFHNLNIAYSRIIANCYKQ